MSYNTDLFVITYHDDYVEIRDSKMQRIIHYILLDTFYSSFFDWASPYN